LIGWALRVFGPLMFRRATQVAVHFARGALALAVFFAASRGFPLSRLIVARAIPIPSRAFAMVALRRSVGGAAVIATAIVVDTTTTMALISAVDNVVASIVPKSNLAFGTLAAPEAEASRSRPRSFSKASQRRHLRIGSASWRSIVPTRRLVSMPSSDARAFAARF